MKKKRECSRLFPLRLTRERASAQSGTGSHDAKPQPSQRRTLDCAAPRMLIISKIDLQYRALLAVRIVQFARA